MAGIRHAWAAVGIDKATGKVEKNELKLSHITIPDNPYYAPRLAISGTITKNGSPLADITVSGDGRTTTTNEDGNYTLGIVVGDIPVTPSKEVGVTPSLTGHTFSPPSISVTLTDDDVSGKDFTAQEN